MASQAKFSEMLSQFSSRDDGNSKPPAPKRTRKVNVHFSQLEVQAVAVPDPAPGGLQNADLDAGWDSDFEEDLNLHDVLSQFDRPADNKQDKQQPQTVFQVPEPPFKLPVQEIDKKKIAKAKDDPKQKDELTKKPPRKQPERNREKTESVSKSSPIETGTTDVPAANSHEVLFSDFAFKANVPVSSLSVDLNRLRNYSQTLESLQQHFDELYATLSNVALPDQENCTDKESVDFWMPYAPLKSCDRPVFKLEEKICQKLEALVEMNNYDREIFADANKMCSVSMEADDVEVRSVSRSPGVTPPKMKKAPLLLQQIARVTDLAAVRTDFVALGFIVCAGIRFLTSIATSQNLKYSDLVVWILNRGADIPPLPCVLLQLLQAQEGILLTDPAFLDVKTNKGNHLALCIFAKTLEKVKVVSEIESGSSELVQSSLRAARAALRAKLLDLVSAVHFAPSFKLPLCLSLAGSSVCLKSALDLAANLTLGCDSKNVLVDDASLKYVRLLFWLQSSDNDKFREIVSQKRAELFHFLSRTSELTRASPNASPILHLLSTYSSWGATALDVPRRRTASSSEH